MKEMKKHTRVKHPEYGECKFMYYVNEAKSKAIILLDNGLVHYVLVNDLQ